MGRSVTVGCDPEVMVYLKVGNDPSEPASSGDFFPDQPLPRLWNRAIGFDGNAIEFRPKPSNDPKEVARDIGTIIKAVSDRYAFAVGSYYRGQCLGGHIHIGSVPERLRYNYYDKDYMCPPPEKVQWGSRLSPTLKRLFLGASYLWVLEDSKTMWHRRKPRGYGSLYSNRGTPNHTLKTIEIRHPSSDWLASPELMNLALTLVQFLAEDETEPDLKAIDKVEDSHIALEASSNKEHGLVSYLHAVEDLMVGSVPPRLTWQIKDWSESLRARRNEDGLILLREEEWL